MDISLNGSKVHFIQSKAAADSAGPLPVFIHGAGMNHRVWQPVSDRLESTGIAGILLDMPGHGDSEGAPIASIDEQGNWIAAFVRTLELSRPVLIGHSMGSVAALAAAAELKSAVSGVVLCGIAERFPVNTDLLRYAAEDRPQAEKLIAKWSLTGSNTNIDMAAYFAGQEDGVLSVDLQACDAYDGALDAAAELRCPALFITGAEDKMTPPKKALSLIDDVHTSKSLRIPDCGHMMQLETPDQVADAIAGFVKSL